MYNATSNLILGLKSWIYSGYQKYQAISYFGFEGSASASHGKLWSFLATFT